MGLILNFAAFQAGWFASVLGGANQLPWLGPVALLIVAATHLSMVSRPGIEFALVIFCGAIGAVFDSTLVAAGWVSYPSGMFADGFAPYWIITMWMLFATTLNVSLRWLHGRPLLAGALGLVAGPLSYVAGAKLGGITLLDQVAAMTALGIGWGAMMPMLMLLAGRLDGTRGAPQGAASRA